jgi:hypothetical protein
MAAVAVHGGISGANESMAVRLPVGVRLCHGFWFGGGARATFYSLGFSERAGVAALVDIIHINTREDGPDA